MDPIGPLLTGGKMIWEGVRSILHFYGAPWNALSINATLRPYENTWYQVALFAPSERPFAVRLLSVKTSKPRRLRLCRANNNMEIRIRPETEADKLEDLPWTIPEKGVGGLPFQTNFFVHLGTQRGSVAVVFELEAQVLDNRRKKFRVWVQTNEVQL